jgi:hypothetical protein
VEDLAAASCADLARLPISKSEYHKLYLTWQSAQQSSRTQANSGLHGMLTSRWYPSLFAHRKPKQLLGEAHVKAHILELLQSGHGDAVQELLRRDGARLVNHKDTDDFTLVHRICALPRALVDGFSLRTTAAPAAPSSNSSRLPEIDARASAVEGYLQDDLGTTKSSVGLERDARGSPQHVYGSSPPHSLQSSPRHGKV